MIKLFAIPGSDGDSSGVPGGDACACIDARANSRKERENAAALITLARTISPIPNTRPMAAVREVNRNNGGAWAQTGPNCGVFTRAAKDRAAKRKSY